MERVSESVKQPLGFSDRMSLLREATHVVPSGCRILVENDTVLKIKKRSTYTRYVFEQF